MLAYTDISVYLCLYARPARFSLHMCVCVCVCVFACVCVRGESDSTFSHCGERKVTFRLFPPGLRSPAAPLVTP